MTTSTAIKERPIPYSGPMVRAKLDGRKTQTRRVVKNPERLNGLMNYGEEADWCPYGKPGDRLWVREAWRIGAWNIDDQVIAVDYLADNYSRREWLQVEDDEMFERYMIQSTEDCEAAGLVFSEFDGEIGYYHWEPGNSPCRKRQGRFMPRFASRMLDEVVSVRVERLQDISEEDAIAEGIEFRNGFYLGGIHDKKGTLKCWNTAKEAYAALWESINGPGSWAANPWVWVVEFREVKA
ncbi:MAG TPA: hypothetical protein VGK71_05950 [Nitrospirota bacterium]|jgi:hypothetical protein